MAKFYSLLLIPNKISRVDWRGGKTKKGNAMKFFKSGWVAFLILGIFITPKAWGQDSEYSLTVGVPVAFKFTEDENTQLTPPSKSPSGFRVMLNTPVYFGIGLANYKSGFEDTGVPFAGRDIEYGLLELMLNLRFGIFRLGIGLGVGEAEFTPERATFGPIVQDFKKSDATERILSLGFMVGETWDINASFHFLIIDTQIETNGIPTSGDIGALLTNIGLGYHF